MDNGYISVTVSDKNGGFGIRTAEGDKVNKSDNDKFLLYEYDGDNTSFTSFQVTRNGRTKEYIFGGEYPGSSDVSVTRSDDVISAVWSVDDLTFTQDIRLVNTGSTEHGTAQISYSVKNTGASADIRCRILMDTALGYQDYAYYRVGGRYLEKETALAENGYEKSFYAVTSPESPRIVAYTINATIDEKECIPYRTVFAHWNNLASTVFDYTPEETMTFTNYNNRKYLTSDSAYALYFDLGTVGTNATASAATNYGVYSNESMDDTAKVSVNVNAPDVIGYALNADGSENQSAYIDDGYFEVKTHMKNITGRDFSKIRIVVTAAGCIEPLDQLGNPTESDLNNPYSVNISDFTAGEQLDIEWKFHAVPQEVGQYGRIQFRVYDVSDEATQNSGQLLLENLLGEGSSYIMCPGSVSKMPVLRFTASSPDTLYTSGIRNFSIVGENFSTLLDKSAYTLKISRQDGMKVNGREHFVIPADQFQIDDSANVISVIFNEENPGTLPEGMYRITLDYTDPQKQDITAPALQFHVSNEEKYKNESYGFLAVVRQDSDEPAYEILRFIDEDAYWGWLEYGGMERENVLLEFRGNFLLQKTEDGSVSYKGISNNRSHNVMTLNGCIDIRNGTCTVTEENGSVTVDFDAEIYTTGSGTFVHKGVAALTELERGGEYGLIQYDENGERGGAAGDPIALLWPSAGEAFQNLMGLLFNFKYCELGSIFHEDAPTVRASETRLAAFGAAMDLSFLIPGSVEKQFVVDSAGKTKDILGSSYDAAEHNQISFSADEIRALNRQADYRNATVNTQATPEDLDMGKFSDMTVDDTPGYNALSIVIDDILFGGEYLGVNLEVALGIPPYILNMPALECVLSVHTVGDWSFSAEGQCHFASFKLQANLSILSDDGTPIVDSLSFFVGGFAPGINVDGVGVLWLQGVQGGIENIYDTIFLTDKIPPIKLILGAQFSILQLFNAYATMGISLRGLDLDLTNGQFTEYTDESTGQVTVPQPITMDGSVSFHWYPEFYFHAAVNLALAQCIRGSGYIVAEDSGFYEFFLRGSLAIPPDIPIIGGYEVAGMGMGVNTEKLWGKINYLSAIDIGVTYYWGGDIDWNAGSSATPTYPELLGDNAGASYMAIPIGHDEETGDTLFMAFGRSLRTASINDKISSDVLEGSTHTMNLEQNGSGKILLISWESEEEAAARSMAEEIVIAAQNAPSETIGVKIWSKDDEDGANANFSYDPESKTAYLSVVFAADNPTVYGRTWNISTMPGALLVVYNVLSMPEFAITDAALDGNTLTLTTEGVNAEQFTKMNVVAEGILNGQIHVLGSFTDPFAENTLTLTIPDSAISDTYTIRAVASDDDNQLYHESEINVAYTNPHQPSGPAAVSAENAGDYKVSVSVSAADDMDGYCFTARDANGAVVNGLSSILLHKDGTTVTFDSEGRIIDALTDDTAGSYIIGGQVTQSGEDEDGNPAEWTAGFEAGTYTVEVRAWKKLPSGAVILSEPAETRITVREPVKTEITVQASAANGKASVSETVLAGTDGEHTVVYLADSTLNFTLSASEAFRGEWRIDGGFREDLRGEINSSARNAITVTGLEEGQHKFTFLGVNGYGDSVSVSYTFAVDTLGPRMLLSEPVNGGLFDYLTGRLNISGITDRNTYITVEDKTTGETLMSRTGVTADSEGAFETTVTLDREILTHDLTITLTDALGNASVKDVSVMSNGLGSIEKLVILSGGTDVTNAKISGPGPYTLQAAAKLKTDDGSDLYVLLNDERMLTMECTVVEGSVDQAYSGTELTLGVNPNAEGMVTAMFHVNDNGTYSASTAFANIVEQLGALTISGDLNVTYGTPVPDVTINTHGSDGTVSVYYYTNADCTEGRTADKPTEAGNYWVKAEMTEGTGFSAAVSNILAFTVSRSDIAVEVSIDGWTYGDDPAEPSVTGNTADSAVRFLYKLRDADDSTYTAEVPTDAGEYTVKAVIAQGTNHNEAAATADFTVAPKDISGVTIESVADQTYTGEAITPTPGVKDGEKNLIPDTDFTYGYENNTNAGAEAVVSITGKGNYSGSAGIRFVILCADLTGVAVNITGWSIGSEPNAPVVTGNAGNGEVTYLYKVMGADDSTYTTEVPTEAGQYTVKAIIADTANYNGTTAAADFVISEKPAQTVTADDVNAVYGDTGLTVSASSDGGGTISYSVKSGEDVVSVDPETGALTILKAGTAVITVTAAESATHAPAFKDIVVVISPKSVAVPAADSAVYTYNGSEQTYNIAASDAYTISGNKQTDANEDGYIVTVALTDKDNTRWSDGSADDKTYTFVIRKATIIVTADDMTAYIGDEVPALDGAWTVTGLADGESLTAEPVLEYAAEPDMEKAGTVAILVSGAAAPEGGNYNEILYVPGLLTILEKTSDDPEDGTDEDEDEDEDEDGTDEDITDGFYVPTFHQITVTTTGGGTVRTNSALAVMNSKVVLTVIPDAGYKLDSLRVFAKNGREVPVSGSDGKFTFLMPFSSVTVIASFTGTGIISAPTTPADCPRNYVCPMFGYTDLVRNNWYHDGIHFCIEEGMMRGTSDTLFGPDSVTTRAMLVTILWRLEGEPAVGSSGKFRDVPAGMWYSGAIEWAAANGIVDGYGNGTFGPGSTITREQMAVIMWRYAQYKGMDTSDGTNAGIASYTDTGAISTWAVPAMQWACTNGLINGTGSGILNPAGHATRAQTAAILYRFCANIR